MIIVITSDPQREREKKTHPAVARRIRNGRRIKSLGPSVCCSAAGQMIRIDVAPAASVLVLGR